MKKNLRTLIVISFLIIVGCVTNNSTQTKQGYSDLNGAPKWVAAPGMEGGFSAVGSDKIGAAGINFAKTNAVAFARDELARSMQVKVKNFIKNYVNSTGVGSDETVDRVSTQTSKQVASQVLNGSQHINTWVSPSGVLYALVVIEPQKLKKSVKESSRSSFKNDDALWQRFQADQSFKELEEEVDKLFGE
jgi:ABC-type Na+ efflux pump permease subunit